MPRSLHSKLPKEQGKEPDLMNIYGSPFSPGCLLNEQIARHIFDILPESGPIVVIMDKNNNHWPSDSEKFSHLNISESLLKEVCAKIDDGTEPIITQANECSIVASQLATERTDCGYVMIVLPQYSPESALINIDLVEILLNLVGLIARLIEKNNLLYELQMKRLNTHTQPAVSSN
jgi:hypothetical protein